MHYVPDTELSEKLEIKTVTSIIVTTLIVLLHR